jgi:hypothetical protein
MAFPALQYFSTLSYKLHDFRKKVTDHTTCSDCLLLHLSETVFIPRRTERDTVLDVHGFSRKIPVILVKF